MLNTLAFHMLKLLKRFSRYNTDLVKTCNYILCKRRDLSSKTTQLCLLPCPTVLARRCMLKNYVNKQVNSFVLQIMHAKTLHVGQRSVLAHQSSGPCLSLNIDPIIIVYLQTRTNIAHNIFIGMTYKTT